jgi:transposase-like protein
MAAYARRHDLNADEGYRWRRILQRGQRWPAATPGTGEVASTIVARPSAPRFARVRIASQPAAGQSWPLRLQLLLSNGRRAELMLGDERQLPRVLALLEQPG